MRDMRGEALPSFWKAAAGPKLAQNQPKSCPAEDRPKTGPKPTRDRLMTVGMSKKLKNHGISVPGYTGTWKTPGSGISGTRVRVSSVPRDPRVPGPDVPNTLRPLVYPGPRNTQLPGISVSRAYTSRPGDGASYPLLFKRGRGRFWRNRLGGGSPPREGGGSPPREGGGKTRLEK